MFGFLREAVKNQLRFEQLQVLVLISQQVVLCVDSVLRAPGSRKKAVAVAIVEQILDEIKMEAPSSLIDVVIESAVKIVRVVDHRLESELKPRQKVDISGRPKTGN